MKKLLLLALLVTATSFAQTKADAFAEIQKLADKAEGMSITNGVNGKKEKIGKQVFTESLVSVAIKAKGSDNTWINKSTNIDWSSVYKTTVYQADYDAKVYNIEIWFKKDFTKEYYTEDDGPDGDTSSNSFLRVYIPAKKAGEAEKYLAILQGE